MIFLIEYDRSARRQTAYRQFDDAFREAAQRERLEREVAIHRTGLDREVVLLDAPDEESLRQTHSRYFYDLREIIERFGSSAGASVVRNAKD